MFRHLVQANPRAVWIRGISAKQFSQAVGLLNSLDWIKLDNEVNNQECITIGVKQKR